MDAWRSSIVDAGPAHIRVKGHDVLELMQHSTFTDLIFLLHHNRLPSADERRLLDAILVGVADHGSGAPSCAAARIAASGNRQSLSAAVAAGVLTIGDEHGGAGSGCMELIAEGLRRVRRDRTAIDAAARALIRDARASGARLPGFGHRVHTAADPRVAVLFELAGNAGLAGDGVRFARALEAAIGEEIGPLPLNIDGALAAILVDLGFPSMVGKLFFIIGRVAGLSAEVLEEHTREKPMRIKIPVTYDGVPLRTAASGSRNAAAEPGPSREEE